MTEKKGLYMSPNGKWGIQAIIPDEQLTTLTVVDKKTLKRHYVMVEHIKKGNSLIHGGYAEKDEDVFVGAEVIPLYVQKFILEYIKERV